MHFITLDSETDFDGWRNAARTLVAERRHAGRRDMDACAATSRNCSNRPTRRRSRRRTAAFTVPAKFIELARIAILHRDPERFALLYRLLWRLRGNHDLLDDRDRSGRRAGSRRWPRRCAATSTRCTPSSASARSAREQRVAFRRLVRAGASHRRTGRAVLRAPLRRHALVDPDAGRSARIGTATRVSITPGVSKADAPDGRPARGNLAALLRQHLQSGAAEGEGDADGDAEEILAEPAGGLAD